jgi:hypothetical protein
MANNTRGCCYWLCKCFFSSEPSPQRRVSSHNENREGNLNSNNFIIGRNHNEVTARNAQTQIYQLPQAYVYTQYNTMGNTEQEFQNRYNLVLRKMILKTTIDREKIISLKEYDRKINNKYNCPICLKYLNHILKSSCCGNYVCIFCYEDYITTNIKYEFVLNCPFCGIQDKTIIFDDVKSEETVKNYTNSGVQSPIDVSVVNNDIGIEDVVSENIIINNSEKEV